MADDGGDDFGANPPPPRDDKDERMNPEDDNGTNNNSNNHGATVAASNTESFSSAGGGGGAAIGSAAMRPVFLGNLLANYSTDQVTELFERCYQIRGLPREFSKSIAVDRIDVKRGYCFVFLKDAASQGEKETIEDFVVAINGIEVPNLSRAVRAEFARGDGRVKRKEDERRKNIAPSDTLFVVNFHEETTKREDLEMLFEPFGELVRIDLKRNYAFIQFRSIDQATKAKEATNGGKLDQSVLTVEYVARQRENESNSNNHRDNRGGDRYRGSSDGRGRSGREDRSNNNNRDEDYNRRNRSNNNNDDRRGGGSSFRSDNNNSDRGSSFRDSNNNNDRGGSGGGGYDDRGGGRMDDKYSRRRESPPPYRGGGRNRSRSRSPPGGSGYGRGGSRSPPRRGGHNEDRDDYRRGGGGGDNYRGGGGSRGSSPPPSDNYHHRGRGASQDSPPGRGASPGRHKSVGGGGDRDRGYRG